MSRRSVISTSPFPPLVQYDGREGESVSMVSIPLGAIEIPTFQRERKQRHIQKIFAEWDETAYVFPLVALFEDRFLVLDGQQRLAAAEMLSLERVVVLLVQGVRSKDRLAEIFLHCNRDRKLLGPFEKYLAAVDANERGSVEIKLKLAEYGFVGAKSAAVNGKLPIGAVVQIHERGGVEYLDRVLMVRSLAWGDTPSREANEARTLLGLHAFLRRHWDKIDDDHLVKVLSRHHPGYLLQATDPERGSFRAAYADYLEREYNRGRRGKARLG